MPSRILEALRRPKRIATSLPELRYLVFQGMKGETGASAYDLAVELGFVGTEAEWVASLKGDSGTPGTPGVSPTVQTEAITGGHRVTITDAEHPQGQSFDVMNGGSDAFVFAHTDRGFLLLTNDDTRYTASAIATDVYAYEKIPVVCHFLQDYDNVIFTLERIDRTPASPKAFFRSKDYVLTVDNTGAYTLTDRPQGGSGGGAVDSVNGKTGAVVLDASDVGALPADTQIPTAVTEQTVAGWGFTKNTGTYSKPSGGIPKTDLASDVQASLGKADTALQQHQSLAGYATKSYVQTAIAAIPDELPAVSSTDNGKFLRVANAAWAAVTVPSAEEASF